MAFRSEEEIDEWSRRHRLPRGRAITMEQTWQLAKRYYRGRLDPSWRRRSIEEAQATLTEMGLTGEFWRLE